MLRIAEATGVELLHVPLTGAAPAAQALAAGQVDSMVMPAGAAEALARDGTIRILATLSPQRLGLLPGIPTLQEQGVPLAVSIFQALFAPARTPAPVLARLHEAMMASLKAPGMLKVLRAQAALPDPMPPEGLAALVRQEQEAPAPCAPRVQRVGPAIRRVSELVVTDLVLRDGAVTGAVALDLAGGRPVTIGAAATIIATGGLIRLYAHNSASANMSGDGYALTLRAVASLIDMEFVQFFPIGHLAPRLIGMDPIMWDPFRYKLGGRLLNGAMEEFLHCWGEGEAGRYVVTRDLATYAITKEVEAGRGSPAGGAFLSFTHVPEARLREAFGPVIDRLAANGIDLTRDVIEVSPIAHYHMGGIRVDTAMRTGLPGLLAAGEAVGGANGANRLSGNAITEALAFGRIAGAEAARQAKAGTPAFTARDAAPALALLAAEGPAMNTAAMVGRLQRIMAADVGPFRTASGLARAAEGLAALRGRSVWRRPAGRARRMTWRGSTRSTCGRCCRSPRRWWRRQAPGPRAAARISGRTTRPRTRPRRTAWCSGCRPARPRLAA